jgi:anti-sigma factor RsiW|tara:strand:- start:652 stop:1185 length:534 start_codon:yes stop_codon:yes gene_type:complete
MDRYQFEDLISDYIENNLSMSQRKQVEAYLEENPEAKHQIKSVKQAMASMKSMPGISTSAEFMNNLNRRITSEKEAKSVVKSTRSFAGYTPLMASLSAVVVIAVVMLGLEFMPESSNQATFTPAMTEQQINDLPVLPLKTNDSMLAESEEDSTNYDEDTPVKRNFDDKIQLVGDKRP